jgi:ubiquinone biosynthesis protein COQ9
LDQTTEKLIGAALPHVAFDGWSAATFDAAVSDAGLTMAQARAACPRGAMDLAVAHHKAGDAAMVDQLAQTDLASMRYSDRVAHAVRLRIELAGDVEVVRKASALFALPQNAGDGAALIWGTADAIWTALGDTSRDVNWYSKRAILSGVYGSAVLFWLGDTSDGARDTADFVDRRIADVMRFEKFKADMRGSDLFGPLANGLGKVLSGVRAPEGDYARDLPGSLNKTGG